MKACILMGSPRRAGNTAQLLRPFRAELEAGGWESGLIRLYDRQIGPCLACRACQRDWTVFGCPQQDDMGEIFDAVLACDLLVLATPIYSWYCTAPMKAALDRLVYGMNKFYGGEKGPALWEAGMIRYCRHSQLLYEGMLAERQRRYDEPFMDEGKQARARAFARKLMGR